VRPERGSDGLSFLAQKRNKRHGAGGHLARILRLKIGRENQAAPLRTSSLGFVVFFRTGLTLIFSRRILVKCPEGAVVKIAGRIVFEKSCYSA
jgi:hypothetical protein